MRIVKSYNPHAIFILVIMQKIFLFIILLLVLIYSKNVFSQQNGCVDSISFTRFLSPYFGNTINSPVRDTGNNIYINGYSEAPERNYNITKFSTKNELVWLKVFRITPFTQIVPAGLTTVDDKANLIFGGGNGAMKFDSAANFFWSKKFKRIDFPTLNMGGSLCTGENEEIYLYGAFPDDLPKTNIIKLDPSGNIMWSKKYGNTDLPKFHSAERILVSQNINTIVLFNHFYYNSANPLDPLAIHGLQIVKINKADGSILQQKTIMYYNDAAGNNQNYFTLKKINYSKSTGTFLLDSWGQVLPPVFRAHILTLLDDNLNLIKTQLYNSAIINPPENININTNNDVVLTLNRPTFIFGFPDNSLIYITINNSLDIIGQRKINLANLAFPNYAFTADVAFKSNGILNFQLMLDASTTSTNNPIYLADNSPFYQITNSNCLGKDTVIYQKGSIYTLPVNNVTYSDVGDMPLTVTDFTPDPYVEKTFTQTEICKEVSICDTIKLFGTSYHCLNNPLDSFKIIRNPLCKRITNWQVDTNYIKILSQTDTTLHVQYLQAFSGNIKVGFGGCTLTDTLYLEVKDKAAPVNLGKDTLSCPGKNIVLHAGTGHMSYRWQDNQTTEFYNATMPGQYWVTVADSCGNTSSDSININPSDTSLTITRLQSICIGDTAFIILPADVNNITWQPATNSMLNNKTLLLYPTQNTVYTITAERISSCPILKTTTVMVKPCPVPVFIPNSFTPNNDGLNDIFKASSARPLQFFRLAVYNRYGQKVFESSNPSSGWDGNFKNSKQPTGGYVYQCSYSFDGRYINYENGYFLLIR